MHLQCAPGLRLDGDTRVRHVPVSFPSDYSLGSLIRVHCVECLLYERHAISAQNCSDRWHPQCAASPGSRAVGSLTVGIARLATIVGIVKAIFLARHAADCGLLVLCSLNEHPARMGVQNGFCKRSLLQAGGHVPLSSPSNYYARVAHTIPLGGMFPCGGTCCLCPSLLGRWLWCDADLKLPNYGSPCGHALWSIIERWSHALHL